MAKAPTSVTNPDGSVTTTTYNADGTVYEVSTVSTAKDGSKTEVRKFASGESTMLKWSPSGTFLGTASQGADGLLSYSDPKTGTRTTYSADGSTPLNRVTYNPDGSQTIDYLNAEDGSVNRTETKTAQQIRQDVVNAARAFTGWSMQPRQGSGFMFLAPRHDRGEKIVLGHTIKAGGGVDDGERVLDIVAAHPSTAKHIATKLAVRFVSDNPPAALVDRVAQRFTATNGDLREVMKTLLSSPEFLSPDAYRAKVKTPIEFVASALRATGADVRTALPLARTLKDRGMQPYFCQPPTGYDETATTWVSAGALVSRMNFAVDLSKNAIRGVRVPLSEEQTVALKIGAPEFQRQ